MEIKVGEYVRTNDGIFKVAKIDGLYIYLDKEYFDKQYQTMRDVTFKERIVNHSFNIIDLIEVGDIIEYQVNSLSELKVGRVKRYRDARSNEEYLGIEGFDITKIYINSILTKEQYERDCYRLEEE